MKKIVPFKKEIIFKENLAEIISISLEHHLEINDYSVIGNFNVSGTYKMTPVSTAVEDFKYDLPFEIALDDHYILDNANVDVEDFYYEIINDRVLSIHIEVAIDNLEEKEIIKTIEADEMPELEQRCIEEENPLPNVFNSISDVETYKSYTIYIVRENDNVESILNKYNITKEELENYNNLSELKIGDKLIIPNV